MKNICKHLYTWCSLLMKSIITCLSVLLFSSIKAAIHLTKISKENRTKDCLILGNGPSLKLCLESGVKKMNTYDTVAVNLFCEDKSFHIIKPNYYVVTDPGFFSKAVDDRIADVQKRFQNGISNVDWNMTLFLPSINKKSTQVKKICNQYLKIVYYNYTPVEGFIRLQHILTKMNLGMPLAMNVMCAAVCLMINLNYKNIFLVGADHSWLASFYVNDKNEVILGDRHFYGENQIKCPSTLSKWLYNVSVGFQTHERLAEYAKYRGAHVWNATVDSYIDAYPRRIIM